MVRRFGIRIGCFRKGKPYGSGEPLGLGRKKLQGALQLLFDEVVQGEEADGL